MNVVFIKHYVVWICYVSLQNAWDILERVGLVPSSLFHRIRGKNYIALYIGLPSGDKQNVMKFNVTK